MDVAPITARLVAALPALAGRVGTALQFANATRAGSLGQHDFSAFLLPVGMRGGQPDAATGMFRQAVERVLGVVLVRRAISDPLGSKVADQLGDDIEAAIGAIAGWGPGDAVGVFRLGRGELLSLDQGVATYQLDFILDDQLRII